MAMAGFGEATMPLFITTCCRTIKAEIPGFAVPGTPINLKRKRWTSETMWYITGVTTVPTEVRKAFTTW